jgi:hypothetical protein
LADISNMRISIDGSRGAPHCQRKSQAMTKTSGSEAQLLGYPTSTFSARTRTDISLGAALLLAPDGCQAPSICHERQQRVRNATVIAILSAQDVKLALGKAESDLVEQTCFDAWRSDRGRDGGRAQAGLPAWRGQGHKRTQPQERASDGNREIVGCGDDGLKPCAVRERSVSGQQGTLSSRCYCSKFALHKR